MARTSSPAAESTSITTLAGAVVVITALYFARDVLIPFALALLLSFLLAPLVLRLDRSGLGRVSAVVLTVLLAFAAIGGLAWVVTWQLVDLAADLPRYRQTVHAKLQSTTAGGGLLSETTRMIRELGSEFEELVPETGTAAERPMPVEVREPPPTALGVMTGLAGPLLGTLASAGVVIVLVIFMLIQLEDLRDRLIKLAGTRRLHATTTALDEAGERISRYLLMQLIVNVSYGIPIGVGLYFIGVPNAPLWGVLAAVLRFVPYIGPWIAAVVPLLLSFAVDPGWSMLLMTFGLFLVAELISNNVMEPWLYGTSAGISTVAIMMAAVFWTWLWGPIGLLLSTPLTVCLVVVGRHVPALGFLNLLLGNEPALASEQRFYQRLLALDFDEAEEIAREHLQTAPLADVFDRLLVPAMSLAETDRHQGVLDENRKRFVLENTRLLGIELAESDAARNTDEEERALRHVAVVCVAATDESDEVAATLFEQLMRRRGFEIAVVSAALTPAGRIEAVERLQPTVVCVSALPPGAVQHAAYTCRQLRSRLPRARIVVGLWSTVADAQRLRERIPPPLADALVTTLRDAVDEVTAALEAGPRDAAPAADGIMQP